MTTSTNYIVACWMGPRTNEDLRNIKDRSSFLKAHVAALSNLKHGIDHVTVVLAEGGDEKGDKYARSLKEICGTPVSVIARENRGLSYASWNAAFQEFGSEFSHHIVVEDDYVPYLDDFDSALVELADYHETYVCGLIDNEGAHAAISNGVIPTSVWEKVQPAAPALTMEQMDYAQSAWSSSFYHRGYPIEEYLDCHASPFWVGRSLRWYGHPSLPPLFVPAHAIDRSVLVRGSPLGVGVNFGSDGEMRFVSEKDRVLWEQLAKSDLQDQCWRGRFTRVFPEEQATASPQSS
jgi:hypothetical protein